jgi:hypothetical protein
LREDRQEGLPGFSYKAICPTDRVAVDLIHVLDFQGLWFDAVSDGGRSHARVVESFGWQVRETDIL